MFLKVDVLLLLLLLYRCYIHSDTIVNMFFCFFCSLFGCFSCHPVVNKDFQRGNGFLLWGGGIVVDLFAQQAHKDWRVSHSVGSVTDRRRDPCPAAL